MSQILGDIWNNKIICGAQNNIYESEFKVQGVVPLNSILLANIKVMATKIDEIFTIDLT